MIRRLWVAGWIAEGMFVFSMFMCGLVGIILNAEMLGNLAMFFGACSFAGAFPMAFWSCDEDWRPAPNLPKADRRELARRRREMEMRKRTRDLERELGMRYE